MEAFTSGLASAVHGASAAADSFSRHRKLDAACTDEDKTAPGECHCVKARALKQVFPGCPVCLPLSPARPTCPRQIPLPPYALPCFNRASARAPHDGPLWTGESDSAGSPHSPEALRLFGSHSHYYYRGHSLPVPSPSLSAPSRAPDSPRAIPAAPALTPPPQAPHSPLTAPSHPTHTPLTPPSHPLTSPLPAPPATVYLLDELVAMTRTLVGRCRSAVMPAVLPAVLPPVLPAMLPVVLPAMTPGGPWVDQGREGETLPRVQESTRLLPWPPRV